jgi:hypothetical protein
LKNLSSNDKPARVLNNAINLALTSAQKNSRRAGVGWSLTDENYNHLNSGGMIAGADPLTLPAVIDRYGDKLHSLVMTLEPLPRIMDVQGLTEALERSSCAIVYICYRNDEMAEASHYWQDWIGGWHGEVVYLPSSAAAIELALGPAKVMRQLQPWVTAVSAADMTGNSIPLKTFEQEFGFSAQLDELVNQSRAICYSTSQADAVSLLSEDNYSGELLELYEVNDVQSFAAILKHCATERRCSVVAIVDVRFLAEMIESNLCNEIIHHLAVADCVPTTPASSLNGLTPPVPHLPLSDWQLINSSSMGNCTQLILRPIENALPEAALGHSLN